MPPPPDDTLEIINLNGGLLKKKTIYRAKQEVSEIDN